jgi:capsular polysaccharide biosynthesis protein
MNLGYLFPLLLAKGWLLATLFVVGAAAGGGTSLLDQDHATSASILVRPTGPEQTQQYVSQPARFIRSEIRIVESDAVFADAVAALGDDTSVRALRSVTSVTGGSVDDVIDVVAHGATAASARKRASELADAYVAVADTAASVLSLDTRVTGRPLAALVAGGGAMGFAAGVVLVLAGATLRRPVVSARHLHPIGSSLDVYPYDLPEVGESAEASSSRYSLLLQSLLPSHAEELSGGRNVLVVDVGRGAARSVLEGLAGAAAARNWDVTREHPAGILLASAPRGETPVTLRVCCVEDPGNAEPPAGGLTAPDAIVYAATAHRTTERLLLEHVSAWRRLGAEAVVVVVAPGGTSD